MKKENNSNKIILDLCGGTGAWSKPYKDAGYDVRLITLPDYDVNTFSFLGEALCFESPKGLKKLIIDTGEVYGVLAAPPCTMFSFARTNAKKPRNLEEGMQCVKSCLNIIWGVQERIQPTSYKTTSLKFWALENPYFGLLKNFIGKPAFVFDPCDFGDSYQKKTALWGNFNEPEKIRTFGKCKPDLCLCSCADCLKQKHHFYKKFDYLKSKDIHPEAFGKLTRQERRAITPAGFANAFFKSNQ